MAVTPVSEFSRASSAMTFALDCVSRLPVGSSASTTQGTAQRTRR